MKVENSLPVNNLSTQSMYAALSAETTVPLQEVHKEDGQQFEWSLPYENKMGEWSLVCGTVFSPLPLSGPQKYCDWGSQREQRPEELWLSVHLNIWASKSNTRRQKGGLLVESWLQVSRILACCQGRVEGSPSRAESWGSLGVVGMCVLDCDAWAVCHSGWGCGYCGEGHRGSGRSQWPFHWVLAGHSLLALWSFRKEGRKK